jgi:hypothetical protein
VPPPFERREHHEQVGCAVALVFVPVAFSSSAPASAFPW